jgi:hypothetical protein
MTAYNLLVIDNSGTGKPVESCEARERTEPPAELWSGPLRPLWVVPNLLGVEFRKKKRILTAFDDFYIQIGSLDKTTMRCYAQNKQDVSFFRQTTRC